MRRPPPRRGPVWARWSSRWRPARWGRGQTRACGSRPAQAPSWFVGPAAAGGALLSLRSARRSSSARGPAWRRARRLAPVGGGDALVDEHVPGAVVVFAHERGRRPLLQGQQPAAAGGGDRTALAAAAEVLDAGGGIGGGHDAPSLGGVGLTVAPDGPPAVAGAAGLAVRGPRCACRGRWARGTRVCSGAGASRRGGAGPRRRGYAPPG